MLYRGPARKRKGAKERGRWRRLVVLSGAEGAGGGRGAPGIPAREERPWGPAPWPLAAARATRVPSVPTEEGGAVGEAVARGWDAALQAVRRPGLSALVLPESVGSRESWGV